MHNAWIHHCGFGFNCDKNILSSAEMWPSPPGQRRSWLNIFASGHFCILSNSVLPIHHGIRTLPIAWSWIVGILSCFHIVGKWSSMVCLACIPLIYMLCILTLCHDVLTFSTEISSILFLNTVVGMQHIGVSRDTPMTKSYFQFFISKRKFERNK